MRILLALLLLTTPALATETFQFYSTDVRPTTDLQLDLGTSSYRFKNIYAGGNVSVGTTSTLGLTVTGAVTTTGNVSIGTTASTATLDVNGGARFRGLSSNGFLKTSGGTGSVGIDTNIYMLPADTLTGLVHSTVSGTNYFTGGNVGIGITVPTRKLAVDGSVYILNGNLGISTISPRQRLEVDGNVYIVNGHADFSQSALPTVSTCGTGSPAVTALSTDNAGEVTFGDGNPTACKITFATPFTNKPHCVIQDEGAVVVDSGYGATTTDLWIYATGSTSGTIHDWHCFGTR